MRDIFITDKPSSKKFLLLFIPLIASVLLNSAFAYYYVYYLVPEKRDFEIRLEKYASITPTETPCSIGQTRLFDKSRGAIVCEGPENREAAISECAKRSRNNMSEAPVTKNLTLAGFEEARNLFMKYCLEEYGYEY